MPDRFDRGRPARPTPPQPRSDHGPVAKRVDAPRPAKARKRAEAPKFPITCDACGAQAEVPFKPAEGREVYCATCYRARRADGPRTQDVGAGSSADLSAPMEGSHPEAASGPAPNRADVESPAGS